MSRILVLAALIIAVAGCAPTTRPVASSTPSTAAAPTSSPRPPASTASSPAAVSRLAGFARPLGAGAYVFEDAFPHVTFEVPSHWFLDEAMPRHFGIRPEDVLHEDTFIVWFDMHLASNEPTCPELPRAGVGHAASDLASGFQGDPGLVTTSSHPITIGGLQGETFDVSLAPTWKHACPFTDGKPSVPLFVDDDIAGEPAFWGVTDAERIRMIVLDDQHGSNILITFDSASGKTLEALAAAASPVLQTFDFDVDS